MIGRLTLLAALAGLLLLTQVLPNEQTDALLMEGVDGEQYRLDDFTGKGQWVVVNVWATACPYCRRELFDFASFHEKHAGKDAMVLGLTLGLATFDLRDKAHVQDFAASYLIEYPLLLVSGELASQVTGKSIHTVPTTFFYNPKGELVYHFTGEMDEAMLEAVIEGKSPD